MTVASPSLSLEERYARAEQFLPWNAHAHVYRSGVQPHWIENPDGNLSDRFWYRNRIPEGAEFILVDPDAGTRQPAFDHARLAAALSAATGEQYEGERLPFTRLRFTPDLGAIQVEVAGKHWQCALAEYVCTPVEAPEELPAWEIASPDGKWVAFTREHNLWLRERATGKERALTSDGLPHYAYAASSDMTGVALTERLEGVRRPPAIIWSPDSTRLVTHQLDQRSVKEWHFLQSVPADGTVRPIHHSIRIPMPGDEHLPTVQLVIFQVEQGTRIEIESGYLLAGLFSPIHRKFVWWSRDARRVLFLEEARSGRSLTLWEADASSGACREVREEQSDRPVLFAPRPFSRPLSRTIGDDRKTIWYSDRDGWPHLYLYDTSTGEMASAITSGDWAVLDVPHEAEDGQQLWVLGTGREAHRNPYFRHLYLIDLQTGKYQLLTPEDAGHEVMFSPSGRYFVDTYSRHDVPPVSVLRGAEGRMVARLEEASFDHVLGCGWRPPEVVKVKAADDVTDVYAQIYRPTHFDPANRYPVVDDVYAAAIGRVQYTYPSTQWSLEDYWLPQALAELGFIVVAVDGRGTPDRGAQFKRVGMSDAGETGLRDHIAVMQQLAASHPYMDLERVGIYGYSAGGYAAARAMLAFPEFYVAGVSGAGSHDARAWYAYGEGAARGPDDPELLEGVNAVLAEHLRGKLLLVHGDLDDNVHPATTLQLVDALIRANKDFDLLILPNRNHISAASDPYYLRRLWGHFLQHLRGETSLVGYSIPPPSTEDERLGGWGPS